MRGSTGKSLLAPFDGFIERCTAPWRRSLGSGGLHEHHLAFPSELGFDALEAVAMLRNGHHPGFLQRGLIRRHGSAPDVLTWEVGVLPAGAGHRPEPEVFQRFRGVAMVSRVE